MEQSYYQVIEDFEVKGTFETYNSAEAFRKLNNFESVRYYDATTKSWIINCSKEVKK